MLVGLCPARPSAAASAIEKQPACAAPISSSGLVPEPSSNRDTNEYAPSNAPLPTRILPAPSFNEPFHSALAPRTAIDASRDESELRMITRAVGGRVGRVGRVGQVGRV